MDHQLIMVIPFLTKKNDLVVVYLLFMAMGYIFKINVYIYIHIFYGLLFTHFFTLWILSNIVCFDQSIGQLANIQLLSISLNLPSVSPKIVDPVFTLILLMATRNLVNSPVEVGW